MDACLHNMALFRQFEGSRAAYMLDVIEQTGEKAAYRDRILATLANLPPDVEDYDAEQLFDFARLFALQGDQQARQVMYAAFLKPVSKDVCTGAPQIIELDGLQGFLFVAARLGQFALDDPDFWDGDFLLRETEEKVGAEAVAAAVKQAQVADPRIAAYMHIVLERRSYRERHWQEQKPDPAKLSYEEIEETIYSRRSGLQFLEIWGQHASERDLLKIAGKLQTEQDPNIVRRLLAVFRKGRFPLDYGLLFGLSQHPDYLVAGPAISALENISHPSVREFALDMIAQSIWTGWMTGLLNKNYQDGDWQLITEITQRNLDREEYHSLGFSVRDIFSAHPTPDSVAALLNLYEKGPCANCRVSVIKCLHQLQAIPPWMIEECRRDSNFYLREYAEKRFEGLGPDW